VVDPQLENEADLSATTTDAAAMVIYPFVLVLGDALWVPQLDLADPAVSPVPFAAFSEQAAVPAAPPSTGASQVAATRLDLSMLLLLLVVGGVGAVALYRGWRQQTSRYVIEQLPADVANSDSQDTPWPTHQETD
jgi:hypothetical protein